MELRVYLHILYNNWVFIVATTLVGVIATATFTMLSTPQYEAQTKLYVSVQTESQASGDLLQGSNFAQQNMATFAELATTESVLDPVIENLDLGVSENTLAQQVNTVAPADSTLLNISVTDADPERAAEIANEIGSELKLLVEEHLERPEGTDAAASPVRVNTVQSAGVPDAPVSPRVSLNLALGLLLGLAVAVGLAVLRTILDTRIRTVHDIEEIVEAPVIGRIADDRLAPKKPLIVHSEGKSPRAESFRELRTNLRFLITDDGPNIFVISSSGPGEGKTTTATNLAIALAETGLKVALVDGDLRKPRVANYMGLEGAVGLSDVLIGRAEVSDVLQRWGRSHLYVLPAGKVPPNPSELLGSSVMEYTLGVLSETVDVVLVDSSPLGMVTDAAVIGEMTQGVLLVAAAGTTKKQGLKDTATALATAGVALRGIVATMLPTKGPGSYGYGNYAYGDEEGTLEDPTPQRAPKRARSQRAGKVRQG